MWPKVNSPFKADTVNCGRMFYVCAGAWFSDFSVGAASSLEFIKTKALFLEVSEGRNI